MRVTSAGAPIPAIEGSRCLIPREILAACLKCNDPSGPAVTRAGKPDSSLGEVAHQCPPDLSLPPQLSP